MKKRGEQAGGAAVSPAEVLLAPPKKKRVSGRPHTVDEVSLHVDFIEQLILERPGLSDRQRALIVKERFNLNRKRLHVLTARIRDRWARESESERKTAREAQIRRLLRYLDMARGKRQVKRDSKGQPMRDEEDRPILEWVEKPNHSAIAKYESLLADLQGTREPVQVAVHVQTSQAILHVIAGLSPEQEEELFQSYLETKLLADKAKAKGVLTIDVSPSEETH